MTRFDPTLRLARFVVLKGDSRAYDEDFHAGVNIIRGDNGGGKSTVADLIFFGLGGEVDLTRFDGHLTSPRLRAEVFNDGSQEA